MTARIFCLDQQRKTNETKGWFFDKINKTDKPVAILTTIKREKTQITLTNDGRGYHSFT